MVCGVIVIFMLITFRASEACHESPRLCTSSDTLTLPLHRVYLHDVPVEPDSRLSTAFITKVAMRELVTTINQQPHFLQPSYTDAA